ncbi:MAG TPA: VIT1/CCC1 transporter family protein [archaeon]|nr:VIT1/CCC1 transporter family protein [archaeon]
MVSHKRYDTGESLRDFVYGFHDGMVTTLAAIVAITVAGLDNKIIILVGFANMIADGISMSLGGYLASKSQEEYDKKIHLRFYLHPEKIALVTFLSFVFAAFIPMIPYFFLPAHSALPYSIGVSVVSFFVVGSLRTFYTKKNWLVAGVEMLAVGLAAVIVAYIVGTYISSLNVF